VLYSTSFDFSISDNKSKEIDDFAAAPLFPFENGIKT
jgi:hypothetical protein